MISPGILIGKKVMYYPASIAMVITPLIFAPKASGNWKHQTEY